MQLINGRYPIFDTRLPSVDWQRLPSVGWQRLPLTYC